MFNPSGAWPSRRLPRRPRRHRRATHRCSPGRRRGSRPRRAAPPQTRTRARSTSVELLERELEAEGRAAEVEQHEDAIRAGRQRRAQRSRDPGGARPQPAVLRAACRPHRDLLARDLRDHLAQPIDERLAVGDQHETHQSLLLSLPPELDAARCSGRDLSRSQQGCDKRCDERRDDVSNEARRPLPQGWAAPTLGRPPTRSKGRSCRRHRHRQPPPSRSTRDHVRRRCQRPAGRACAMRQGGRPSPARANAARHGPR